MSAHLLRKQSHLMGVSDLKNTLLRMSASRISAQVTVWGQTSERAFSGPVVLWNKKEAIILCRTGELYTLTDQEDCLQFNIQPSILCVEEPALVA